MMALIRSLVIPTIWGNCARCMFKFDSGYFFPECIEYRKVDSVLLSVEEEELG